MIYVLLAMVAFGAGPARVPYPRPPDLSNEKWVLDLQSEDVSKRLYAARVLRARVKEAAKKIEHLPRDSERYLEALATLEDLEILVVPACMEALPKKGATVPCADILGIFEVEEAIKPISSLLLGEGERKPGPCERRRLMRALSRIQSRTATHSIEN